MDFGLVLDVPNHRAFVSFFGSYRLTTRGLLFYVRRQLDNKSICLAFLTEAAWAYFVKAITDSQMQSE